MSAVSISHADVEQDPPGFGRALGVTCAILCPLVAVATLALGLVVGFDFAGSLGLSIFSALTAGFGFALIIAGAVWGSAVTDDH